MSVFQTMIGWIAPPDCIGCGLEGTSLCEACSASEIIEFGERCFNCSALSPGCRACQHCRRPGTPRAVFISSTYDGLGKKLVQAYKFSHRRSAANDLAGLMLETLNFYNSSAELRKLNYLVAGVPTASMRVRERGFDHATLLAKNIARRANLEYATPLGRLGQARQVGAKRTQRLSQQANNYYVSRPQPLKNRNILLVDDVVTTGATLRAATKALRAAGARHVDALVFAKRL